MWAFRRIPERRQLELLVRGHVLEHVREPPEGTVELDFADVFFQMSRHFGIEGERDSLAGQWETIFVYDDNSLMEGDYLANGLRGLIAYPVDADIPVAPFLHVSQLVLDEYAKYRMSEVQVSFLPVRYGSIVRYQSPQLEESLRNERDAQGPLPEPFAGEVCDFSVSIRAGGLDKYSDKGLGEDSDKHSGEVDESKEGRPLSSTRILHSEWSLKSIGELCSEMIDDCLPYIYGGKDVEFLFRKEKAA